VLRRAVAGTLALGTIGSCELPKPQIPTIGMVATGPALEAGARGQLSPATVVRTAATP
jgi:hypothetical protein